jgi:Tol biopolymer transport system component
LVFESTRDGNDLFVRDADGSTDRRIPLRMETGFPSDWSPDGRTILFGDKANGGDVYATTPRGDSLRKVLSSDATEMQAVFSPDGQWIAYASDEQNRRFEVFVRRWPITDEKWLVSTAGGTSPRWRGDGKELYFMRQDVAPSTTLFAVDVNLRSSAPVIGAERLLFERSFASVGLNLRSAVNYDVRKDGQQFVAVVVDDAPRATAPSVELLLNWQQSGKPERPR